MRLKLISLVLLLNQCTCGNFDLVDPIEERIEPVKKRGEEKEHKATLSFGINIGEHGRYKRVGMGYALPPVEISIDKATDDSAIDTEKIFIRYRIEITDRNYGEYVKRADRLRIWNDKGKCLPPPNTYIKLADYVDLTSVPGTIKLNWQYNNEAYIGFHSLTLEVWEAVQPEENRFIELNMKSCKFRMVGAPL